MRTTKHFTPDLLDRYRELGRGLGTYESYIPWHRVSRSDPSSRGRSHLVAWRGRHYELLSDGEHIAFLFAVPLLGPKEDLREQFPLALETAPHELAAYDARYAGTELPGTLAIADRLGIRHPKCNGGGRSAPWVMTTDLLIMCMTCDGTRSLQAISCKDGSKLSKRAKTLLEIEREYWKQRGATWMLLTPDLYHVLVGRTLQQTYPWALSASAPENALAVTERVVGISAGRSMTYVLQRISDVLHDMQLAQQALWQAIWWGRSPVDLRRGWRPHIPLMPLDLNDFKALNPIASGRSSWI
jgi:hypothetical protein